MNFNECMLLKRFSHIFREIYWNLNDITEVSFVICYIDKP